MLLQFRKFSRSAIAAVILGLVGLAMVLFLPSGQFGGITATDVAKVGDYSVTPQQLARELQRDLRIRREQQGQNITQQEAIDAGLHNQILEGLITRLAFHAYADKIGVSASDRQVADAIREIPQVLNPVTGQFDQLAYQNFLRQIEYTQGEFENVARGDMTQRMLLEALAAGIRSPSSYGKLMLAYQSETRVVSIAELPATAIGQIPPPTEQQLQAFYQESREALRVPEFRALTFVIARVEDFIPRVTVAEDELAREVEARRAAVAAPERRTYVRLTAQNEQQANEIAQRLARGETPAAIASDLGVLMQRGENQARSEVTDEAVAAAVFEMGAGAPERVVRGRLAPYVVVRVESITAAPPVDVAALRAQIREAIAREEAADLLNAAIGAFEDAHSGGASVADAARQHGLTVLNTPPVTAQGRTQQGEPIEALSALAEPMRAAFEIPEGEITDFLPAETGDVIVSVDRIIPASVRPFAEVRDALAIGWTNRERQRRLQEIGRTVVTAVNGGAPLAEAARANRMNLVVRSQTLNRQAAQQIPARALATQIFQSRVGEASSDLRADGDALLVAVVEEINRTNPAEAPQLVERVREQDQQVLTNTFVETIASEITRRMRPSRNQRLLDRTFAPTASAAAQE
jgi:peptidyl-prolyl cis-trans isomerase D